jgi:hypothetical protein
MYNLPSLIAKQLSGNAMVLPCVGAIIIKNFRNRPTTYDSLRKMTVRTLPRDPPGEAKEKKKNHVKHIQVIVRLRCAVFALVGFGLIFKSQWPQ